MKNIKKNKILIIRFSSYGDIIQNLSVIAALKDSFHIDWLVKSEFSHLVEMTEGIGQVVSFDKKSGILGLIKLAIKLRKDNYTHLYDAHSNIRSFIFKLFFKTFNDLVYFQRSKDRLKRILLFNFRINKFDWPFRGVDSYKKPIQSILSSNHDNTHFNFPSKAIDKVNSIFNEQGIKDFIVFAPSAAWEMKRWPIEHWKSLAVLLKNHKIVILGGPSDLFCNDIAALDKERIISLAGVTSLVESSYVVSQARVCVSADTGVLHVADVLNIPTIALIGPTAFGFPSSKNSKVCEVNLDCRPCSKDGRGKCTQDVYQKCMVDITPQNVLKELISFL